MPHHILRAIAVTAATTIALAGLGAGVAQAGSPNAAGKIVRTTSSYWFPTTVATKDTTYQKGKVLYFDCKLNGPSVDGNSRWYLKIGGGDDPEFLPARYVENLGKAPKWCAKGDWFYEGKIVAKPSLTMRAKPTTSSAAKGTVEYGKQVSIICKLNGKTVGGNQRWYQLAHGAWVPARYVANVGDAPAWCHL